MRIVAGQILLSGVIAIAPLMLPCIAHAAKEKLLHSFGWDPDGNIPLSGVIRGLDGTLYGTTEGGGKVDCGGGEHCGTVYKITPDGQEVILHSFGSIGGQYPFDEPVLDNKGNLYGTASEYFSQQGQILDGVVFEIPAGGAYKELHVFTGPDGASPGGVTADSKGNVYGVTPGGGANGHGVLYEITSRGKFRILHAFTGDDGAAPSAAPFVDSEGDIYGTTLYGGGACDCGTVYKVTPDGKETVLHSFAYATDGSAPIAPVVRDDDGNLYGTAQVSGPNFYGTLFKLSPKGRFSVLHAFGAGNDGRNVYSPPTLVKNGAGKLEIYGLTSGGGGGQGTAYKYWGNGRYKIIHVFNDHVGGPFDGVGPQGLLATDSNGHFYGASNTGGTGPCGGGRAAARCLRSPRARA